MKRLSHPGVAVLARRQRHDQWTIACRVRRDGDGVLKDIAEKRPG